MTAYSIGEIEIMVYEEDALGTSHSEVHVISLLNWVEAGERVPESPRAARNRDVRSPAVETRSVL